MIDVNQKLKKRERIIMNKAYKVVSVKNRKHSIAEKNFCFACGCFQGGKEASDQLTEA